MPQADGVPEQGLRVGEQVMAGRHRLRPLQMGVAGHRPVGVGKGLPGQRLDQHRDGGGERGRRGPAEQAEV